MSGREEPSVSEAPQLAGGPGRVSRRVAIVTPWYPTLDQPFRGAFVRAAVQATEGACDRTTVFHCDDWAHALSPRESAAAMVAYRQLLPRTPSAHIPSVAGTHVVYLPVPLRHGGGYAGMARQHADVLGAALGGAPIDADVVQAHVGLPSGWAALRNAGPHTRVFVTEHASFLPRVLSQPDARAMYDELLHRCAGFAAVGQRVRGPLVEAFPHHADRIAIQPNPVSFATTRDAPLTGLNRWVCVGALIPAKGVDRVLAAFALCRARDRDLTLTFVGDGESRESLVRRAAELGVAGAVTFAGAVAPEAALRLMREHDLLVHASRAETFGMVVVEAVAAGMPVLVTRCGGPEEILAGVESAAAELVEVGDDPQTLAEGYQRLRARFPDRLDLSLARRVLAERYSYEAYERAQIRCWFPSAPVRIPGSSGD